MRREVAAWPRGATVNGQLDSDTRNAKKLCRRPLAVTPYAPTERLQLPDLIPQPLPRVVDAVSTWDCLIKSEFHIVDDCPISELTLKEQDAYFSTQAWGDGEVLAAATAAVQGHVSRLVRWDNQRMRMMAQPVRLSGISELATEGILQECADIGSYVRRLRLVVVQIESMQPSQVLLALASAIDDEVDDIARCELDASHPLRLIDSAAKPGAMAHLLARVVGCADLDARAELKYVPSTAQLLNTAYCEMLRVQQNPTQYSLLWRIIGRTIQPWLSQLNRMLGAEPALLSLPQSTLHADFLADVFVAKGDGFFDLLEPMVPDFIPTYVAQLAVESLNCGVVLEIKTPPLQKPVSWPESSGEPSQKFALSAFNGQDPFSLGQLGDRAPAKKPLFIHPHSPTNPQYTVHAILQPVQERHTELNQAVIAMLLGPGAIRHHATILTELFCLRNGKLFAALQDPVDTMLHQADSLQWEFAAEALDTALENSVTDLGLPAGVFAFRFKKSPDTAGTEFLRLRYTVDTPADRIITPRIVEAATTVFRYLLDIQNAVKRHSDARCHNSLVRAFEKLQAVSLEIAKFHRGLDAALAAPNQTLVGLVRAFEQIYSLAELCSATPDAPAL